MQIEEPAEDVREFVRWGIGPPFRPDLPDVLVDDVALALRQALFIGPVQLEFGLGSLDQLCDEAGEKFCRSARN